MTNKTFSLADLIPEPLYFRDVSQCGACGGDGCDECGGRGNVPALARHEVRTVAMFGPTDLAVLRRLQREMQEAMTALQQATDDTVRAEAAQTLGNALDEMLALVMPTLDVGRIQAMEQGHKLRIVGWWREQQPQPKAASGEAVARGRVTRGQRSRALSTPATTRTRS